MYVGKTVEWEGEVGRGDESWGGEWRMTDEVTDEVR